MISVQPDLEIKNPEAGAPQKFDQWALLELFGHNQIVGRVTETTIGGGAFVRVDVPALNGDYQSPSYTRFFNPSAIYSISPVDEAVARSMLTQSRFRNEPVHRWHLPQLPERTGGDHDSSTGGSMEDA